MPAPTPPSDFSAATTIAAASAFTCHGSAIPAAFWDEISFHATRDIGFLLACLDKLRRQVPRYKPLSVGVVLLDLVPSAGHQFDLYEHQKRQGCRR